MCGQLENVGPQDTKNVGVHSLLLIDSYCFEIN